MADVRRPQQTVGVLIGAARPGDSYADAQCHRMAVDHIGPRDELKQSGRHLGALASIRQQYRKLVAADTGDRSELGHGAPDPPGHTAQHTVAGRNASAVVDRLEAVEVQCEQCRERAAGPRVDQCPAEYPMQRCARA